MRLGVAIESDVSDLGNGDKVKQSVDHAEPGTKYRNDSELLTHYSLTRHRGNGGIYPNIVERKIAGELVAHQLGDLVEKLTEVLSSGLGHSHDSQLVLDKRMVNYV